MFALCSNITIGQFRLKPHSVKVSKSAHEFVDKAVIKLPITARVKRGDETVSASLDTAKQFTEGDQVLIQLGYNGVLVTEFTGFVSRVNLTAPVEVECEGMSFLLRKKTYPAHTFKKAKLLDILRYLTSGTGIVVDKARTADVVVDKLLIEGENGTEILEAIKKKLSSLISFRFVANVLVSEMFPIIPESNATVKYLLGWNVIKDNNLKLRQAKNQELKVKYTGKKKDGTKVSVISGNKGEVKEFTTHDFVDQATLKKMADAQKSKMSYDGYEGKITAFGIPFCAPAYRCELTDKKYPERSGSYIVETVEVEYNMSGYRRKVGIGLRL